MATSPECENSFSKLNGGPGLVPLWLHVCVTRGEDIRA